MTLWAEDAKTQLERILTAQRIQGFHTEARLQTLNDNRSSPSASPERSRPPKRHRHDRQQESDKPHKKSRGSDKGRS